MFSTYFIPKKNRYRDLSPVTKFIISITIVTIGFFTNSPQSTFWLIPITLFLLRIAEVPIAVIKSFLRVLYTLIPIISISWLLLFREGEVIWKFWILTITDLGLQRALAMDFRFIAIILTVPLILGTMPQQELIAVMRKLKIPYMICFIIALTLRFIPTLMFDYDQIAQAQMARGLELQKVTVFQKVKNLVATILPMLALAIVRIETLSKVIECRGLMITKGKQKTFYKNPVVRPIDNFLITISLTILIITAVLRYGYGFFVIG